MASTKQFVYAWITYFLALCGVAEFYIDTGAGKVVKSRFLCIFRKAFCILSLCFFSWITFLNTHVAVKFTTQSKLLIFIINAISTITLMTNVISVSCALRWQQRILQIIRDLLRIEKLITTYSNFFTISELSYIQKIFWFRVLLLMARIITIVIQTFLGRKKIGVYLIILGSKLVRYGCYLLTFSVLWQICSALIKLQSYLKQLYLDPMPVARKEQKVLEAHRMYYKLVRITSDSCDIFKYPTGFCLLLMITKFCRNGYFLFRILLGNPLKIFTPYNTYIMILLSSLGVCELYALASIVNLTARVHDATFQMLRNLTFNTDVEQRSNEWLALQLTWQNKSFNIFGVLDINLHLVFLLVVNTLLNVLYVMQSDYNYIY